MNQISNLSWRKANPKTSTVWVVHPVSVDVSAARVWGSVAYVSQGGYIYTDELTKTASDYFLPPVRASRDAIDMMSKFDPLKDYVLIAGDHLQMMIVTAKLTRLFDKFVALRYDRKAEGYVPVLIQ